MSPSGVTPTCKGFPFQLIVTGFNFSTVLLSIVEVSVAPSNRPTSLESIESKRSFTALNPSISNPAKLPPCSTQDGIAANIPPKNFIAESAAGNKTASPNPPETSPFLWSIIYCSLLFFLASSDPSRAGNKLIILYCLDMFFIC